MTRAIILAAGQGTRLRPLTDDIPKAMVKLFGTSIIEHQVACLRRAGISRISIVAGYRADRFAALGLPVIVNHDFESTNMVASLATAREEMLESPLEDVLICYGDIVYQDANLAAVLRSDAEVAVMVDSAWRKLWEKRFDDPLSDAETMVLDGDRILDLGRKPDGYDDIHGQFTGLIKFRADRVPDLAEQFSSIPENVFARLQMTDFLRLLIGEKWDVRAAMVESGWLETDTVDDHRIYHEMDASGELAGFFRY